MKFNLKTGLYFALATAIISGVSNFLNKKAIAVVGDSFIFTTAKNILVALSLCAILLFFAKFKESHIQFASATLWIKKFNNSNNG